MSSGTVLYTTTMFSFPHHPKMGHELECPWARHSIPHCWPGIEKSTAYCSCACLVCVCYWCVKERRSAVVKFTISDGCLQIFPILNFYYFKSRKCCNHVGESCSHMQIICAGAFPIPSRVTCTDESSSVTGHCLPGKGHSSNVHQPSRPLTKRHFSQASNLFIYSPT